VEQDCRHCKDWRACLGKTRVCPKCAGKGQYKERTCDECDGTGYVWEGYLFAELRWCPYQTLWVLSNAEILHLGRWPKQYDLREDSKRSRRIQNEGYFVKPAIIIAEVEDRLGTTLTSLSSFDEGKLLYAQAKAGETLQTLDDDAWDALMYVKGFNRKIQSFSQWRKDMKNRKKHTQKYVNQSRLRL